MVMRNRHDGTNTPGWWDDLPPAVRRRFTPFDHHEPEETRNREPADHRPGIIRDLSRLAALFLIIALVNLLFLLIAITFLLGGSPTVR